MYMGSSNNPRPPQNSTERELFTCVCGALMANEEITAHMSEECPKRLTLCQYCRKQVGHSELQVRVKLKYTSVNIYNFFRVYISRLLLSNERIGWVTSCYPLPVFEDFVGFY